MMVQCEICHVWQHGHCVNIPTEKYAPEHYFCEICKPELHPYNPHLLTDAKKRAGRQTMNSLDSISLEQVLQMSLDESTKRKRGDSDSDHSKKRVKRTVREQSSTSEKPMPSILYDDNIQTDLSTVEGTEDLSDAPKRVELLVPTPKTKRRNRRANSPNSTKGTSRMDDSAPLKPRNVPPRASLMEMCRRVRNVLEWAHRMQGNRSEVVNDTDAETYEMLERLVFQLETFQSRYRGIAYAQRRANVGTPLQSVAVGQKVEEIQLESVPAAEEFVADSQPPLVDE